MRIFGVNCASSTHVNGDSPAGVGGGGSRRRRLGRFIEGLLREGGAAGRGERGLAGFGRFGRWIAWSEVQVRMEPARLGLVEVGVRFGAVGGPTVSFFWLSGEYI